jgi:hypothetical protein
MLGLDPPGALRALGGRAPGAAAEPAGPAGPTPDDHLSAAQLDDLLAFAGILVEGRTLSADERRVLLDHVAARTGEGGGYYLSLYRTTVALLARLAGAPFSSLDLQARIALIERHRLGSSRVRPGEPQGPSPDEMEEVRARAVPDLIAGYYASPAGWAAVGYTTFPGRCGDLARYTRAE